jgi:hypothetical protein
MGQCVEASRVALSRQRLALYFRADAGFANREVEVYEHLEAGARMRSDQKQVDHRDEPVRKALM